MLYSIEARIESEIDISRDFGLSFVGCALAIRCMWPPRAVRQLHRVNEFLPDTDTRCHSNLFKLHRSFIPGSRIPELAVLLVDAALFLTPSLQRRRKIQRLQFHFSVKLD